MTVGTSSAGCWSPCRDRATWCPSQPEHTYPEVPSSTLGNDLRQTFSFTHDGVSEPTNFKAANRGLVHHTADLKVTRSQQHLLLCAIVRGCRFVEPNLTVGRTSWSRRPTIPA